jgi:hypothetical protein
MSEIKPRKMLRECREAILAEIECIEVDRASLPFLEGIKLVFKDPLDAYIRYGLAPQIVEHHFGELEKLIPVSSRQRQYEPFKEQFDVAIRKAVVEQDARLRGFPPSLSASIARRRLNDSRNEKALRKEGFPLADLATVRPASQAAILRRAVLNSATRS